MFLISTQMTVWLNANNCAAQFITNVKAECTQVWSKALTYNCTLPCTPVTIFTNGSQVATAARSVRVVIFHVYFIYLFIMTIFADNYYGYSLLLNWNTTPNVIPNLTTKKVRQQLAYKKVMCFRRIYCTSAKLLAFSHVFSSILHMHQYLQYLSSLLSWGINNKELGLWSRRGLLANVSAGVSVTTVWLWSVLVAGKWLLYATALWPWPSPSDIPFSPLKNEPVLACA